jgi:hypothetical protein
MIGLFDLRAGLVVQKLEFEGTEQIIAKVIKKFGHFSQIDDVNHEIL